MFNLFSKKKKFKANCDLSGDPLEKETAYMISTAQIISSHKFWDNIMTEPDTMSYTEAHFKNGDSTATNIRNMIFKKYAGTDKAWVISDAQLHLFELDESAAKSQADKWWDSEGKEVPVELNTSLEALDSKSFDDIKNYAVQEAGRKMMSL